METAIGNGIKLVTFVKFEHPEKAFLPIEIRFSGNLISDNEEQCLEIAKNFIVGKVYNSRWTLDRTLRDHALRIDQEKFKSITLQLDENISEINLKYFGA